MIEVQCQAVQRDMVSTKWPPFMVQCVKNSKFLWPCKKVKKRSRSKQQVLCTTSSSQLTVEMMIKGQSQTVQCYGVHKVTPVHGTSFCDLAKGSGKGQGQNNGSCVQLHHPSQLLKPWLKVKLTRFNELWGPQSDPHLWYNMRKILSFCEKEKVKITGLVHNFIIPTNCWNDDWRSNSHGSMSYGVHKKSVSDVQTHRQTDGRYYQVPNGQCWGTKHVGLLIT